MAIVLGIVAMQGWAALDLGIGLIVAALTVPAPTAGEALAGALGPSSTVTLVASGYRADLAAIMGEDDVTAQ